MDRFAVVDNMLLRGSVPDADDLAMLKNVWGVKNIVSLGDESGEKIHPICQQLGLRHLIIPIGFGDSPNVRSLASIMPALVHDGPSYVHCYHGQDRTGMAVAMYRVATGWPLNKALREAVSHGMGARFIDKEPEQARTYYEAVARFAGGGFDEEKESDVNEARAQPAADIVELQRDILSETDRIPASNDTTQDWSRHTSLVGVDDPDVGPFLSRPAAQRVYRRCERPADVLTPKQWWWKNIKEVQGNGTMYSAVISSHADLENFKRDPNQAMMRSALLHDKDVAQFMNRLFYVINPDALIDIQEYGAQEEVPPKDAPPQKGLTMGQHDNYTGVSQYVFPGGSGYGYDGGVTGSAGHGAAGFAAPISGPQTGLDS
jgi:hypothetical protein